jgi:hypothetical protein
MGRSRVESSGTTRTVSPLRQKMNLSSGAVCESDMMGMGCECGEKSGTRKVGRKQVDNWDD